MACSAAVFADMKVVTMAIGEWAPYTSKDSAKLGFLPHVAEEAFAREGIEVYWRFMPWRRVRSQVQHGSADASIGWHKSPERAEKLLFSMPVIQLTYSVFQPADKRFHVQTSDDLMGKIIGIHIESHHPSLTALIAADQITLMRFPNHAATMRALLIGRIEGVLVETVVGYHAIRTNFSAVQATHFHTAPASLDLLDVHMITSKSLEKGPQIVAAFESGLKKLHTSGRFAQLVSGLHSGAYD